MFKLSRRSAAVTYSEKCMELVVRIKFYGRWLNTGNAEEVASSGVYEYVCGTGGV